MAKVRILKDLSYDVDGVDLNFRDSEEIIDNILKSFDCLCECWDSLEYDDEFMSCDEANIEEIKDEVINRIKNKEDFTLVFSNDNESSWRLYESLIIDADIV